MTLSVKQKLEKSAPELMEQFHLKNKMAVPHLEKIVVSTGFGSIKDKGKIEIIPDRLAKITGQKPAPRSAKKSIATFKLREGDVVGNVVTLRGERMYNFLDKFINIAIPRQRDFRGINPKAIDEMGNLTIGLKEHSVFPESADEELKNVFGLSITIVTTTKNPQKARALFGAIGIPFKK